MKLKKYLLWIGLLLGLNACDEQFEEFNTNPNTPTDVNAGLILPSVIQSLGYANYYFAFEDGLLVAQHAAAIIETAKDRYFWAPNDYHWNTLYSNLRNIENIYQLGEQTGNTSYQAIALTLRAYAYTHLTSAYGDIPYTEAIAAKTNQIYTPAYDEQQFVFEQILADLAQANDWLVPSAPPIVGDILYQGDLTKWKKLANALRLRVLLRLSNKRTITDELQQIVANEPLMASNADNAYVTQVPSLANRDEEFRRQRLSFFADSVFTVLNDPRVAIHYQPTESSVQNGTPEFVGVPNGLSSENSIQYNGGIPFTSRLGAIYFDVPNSGVGIMMTYSEQQLILAEAAERGWLNGDAVTYYEQGITADIAFRGATLNGDYFVQETVAYTGSSTEKLNKILTQKWITLWGVGMEAWFNWRRTKLPAIQPAVEDLNGGRIPVRFLYPTDEPLLNATNYQTALERQGADDINTPMWLLR